MRFHPLVAIVCILASSEYAHAQTADAPAPAPQAPPIDDLFPGAGRPTVAVATGLPFLGIVEGGVGVTNGITIGAVAGITPSVITAGIRPRLRVATGKRTALILNVPMLWYPKASAPGPGNVGTSAWVLTRPELFFDGAITERWHLAGGMGIIAAASTEALSSFAAGRDFKMPPYNGAPESRKGFAGGVWNTIASRASFALEPETRLFAEGSLVMDGVALADNVGGPPIVITVGVQHAL